MCLFRGLVGVFYSIYSGKKLIESPFSHGINVPCCDQTALRSKEIHNHHEVNIVELLKRVKYFLFTNEKISSG